MAVDERTDARSSDAAARQVTAHHTCVQHTRVLLVIPYHITSYQGFLVRPLLREPRPQVHYKSQPDATAQREHKSQQMLKA